MEYIRSLTEKDLCDFILNTKESLYICLPLLQPDVLDAIAEMDFYLNSNTPINIGIDFSPETFRQGYGEIKSYDDILMSGYNVLNMKDNRISFVISDNVGYYLFFESRYFIPAEKQTLNAVQIDPISIVRLKQHFFQNCKNNSDFSNEIANAMIDESLRLKEIDYHGSIKSSKIDNLVFDNVISDLKQNPPLKPDYQRVVQIYKNKLQYVRLEYKGANLKSKKVEIPPKILPIKNTTFKKNLETKLNLFSNSNTGTFKDFEQMKSRVKTLREKYLKSISSRNERVLNLSEKELFVTEIETLKIELDNLTKNNLSLISNEILKTKQEIRVQLQDFFIQYKEEFPSYNSLFGMADENYVLNEINSYVDKVIGNIKWPAAHQLFENFELKVFFSDITFEDLNNKSLLNELKEKNIISEADIKDISDINQGIELEK